MFVMVQLVLQGLKVRLALQDLKAHREFKVL
jgi:hypothetical protein